ncbi:fatty acid desaturase family protein [Paraflavitalea speifideaquila]|uniref:fatty acid desaturase family protein n=1 Tax=Paraflavitalea speifideaquila TaxID=3076558 RepID=UPI0028F009CA|nr:fatty acid desaturase [Paraflavitalea speifideiaquila]
MRDKHIHIPQDSELLKTIYRQVEEQLVIDQQAARRLIVLKFVVYFTLSVLSYGALYKISEPLLFISCFIVYGFILLLFAFNFSHDFSHNRVFKSKRLNNTCFTIIYTLVGAHAEAWKERHIHSHHYAPNVEDYDSDLQITQLIRVIPHSEYRWYHRYQPVYAPVAYMSYSLYWVFIKDFVILFSKDIYKARKNFPYHLSFWIQKAIYLFLTLVLPLLFTAQPWYIVVTGFLCMHLTQSLFLLFTFFMTHHVESTAYPVTDQDGFINTSWLMNQVKSSNDMHPFSAWANFLLGGFNNHIAHHLFPHIHHIHYPRLNRILYGILLQHHIKPNQTTYWGGVVSHLRLLKKMSHA